MLHTYATRFDVTENLKNFFIFRLNKQGLNPQQEFMVAMEKRWQQYPLASTA